MNPRDAFQPAFQSEYPAAISVVFQQMCDSRCECSQLFTFKHIKGGVVTHSCCVMLNGGISSAAASLLVCLYVTTLSVFSRVVIVTAVISSSLHLVDPALTQKPSREPGLGIGSEQYYCYMKSLILEIICKLLFLLLKWVVSVETKAKFSKDKHPSILMQRT